MADYIDRQEVIETLAFYREDPDGIDHALNSIKNIPSADVQPVKHGQWIDGDYRCVTAVCSNCNRLRLGNGAKSAMRLALYCEKCGARMDGET